MHFRTKTNCTLENVHLNFVFLQDETQRVLQETFFEFSHEIDPLFCGDGVTNIFYEIHHESEVHTQFYQVVPLFQLRGDVLVAALVQN